MQHPFADDSDSRASWPAVEAALCRMTGQALGRVSRNGFSGRIPQITADNPVCAQLIAHPVAGMRCREQCGAALKSAFDNGRTQLFQCHAGLAVFATALTGEGGKPGDLLTGGKAFLSYAEIQRFKTYADELQLDPDTLEAVIPAMAVRDLADVKRFMEEARAIADTVTAGEETAQETRDQVARTRYLFEILDALESESPADIPQAVLHGLAILFQAPAGVVLQGNDTLAPVASFSGNGGTFPADTVSGMRIARTPWLAPALEGAPVRHDSVYDLLQAGFPAETGSVDLFGLSGLEEAAVVALLNTPLTREDRAAATAFCRHAGLLLERDSAHREITYQDVVADISPNLWETADAETLCQGILDRSIATVGAEQGSVMLLDPEEDRLRIRAMQGINLKYVEYVRIRPGEGISGGVLSRGEPLLVHDITEHPETRPYMRSRYKSRSFISLPIQLGDRPMGVINVADKAGGAPFTDQDLKRLIPISRQAALAIDRIQALQQTEKLKKATMTDYLTGLLNRESFDRRLAEEVDRAQRYPYGNPLSLLVVDIDDFKQINGTRGYFVGDDCIKACAHALQAGTRTIDSVYRRGGEEFTVILPHTSRDAALTLAERLCRAIESLEVTSAHTSQPVALTVSIGLATFPEDGDTGDDLFNRAEEALHYAKRNGKNQVITLPPVKPMAPPPANLPHRARPGVEDGQTAGEWSGKEHPLRG